MRAHNPGRYAALALLLGGLACAGNKASDDGSVVAQDSTQANDTSAYKGQERDTTMAPAPAPTPADTTQYQPQAAPAPTPTPTPTDTSSYAPPSTPTDTGAAAQPTSPAPAPSADSSWSKDTTGGAVKDSTSPSTPQ